MSRVWVYKQAEKGLLPFHRVGEEAIRFDPEEIRTYLKEKYTRARMVPDFEQTMVEIRCGWWGYRWGLSKCSTKKTHLAERKYLILSLERAAGFGPATLGLGSRCSTN